MACVHGMYTCDVCTWHVRIAVWLTNALFLIWPDLAFFLLRTQCGSLCMGWQGARVGSSSLLFTPQPRGVHWKTTAFWCSYNMFLVKTELRNSGLQQPRVIISVSHTGRYPSGTNPSSTASASPSCLLVIYCLLSLVICRDGSYSHCHFPKRSQGSRLHRGMLPCRLPWTSWHALAWLFLGLVDPAPSPVPTCSPGIRPPPKGSSLPISFAAVPLQAWSQ